MIKSKKIQKKILKMYCQTCKLEFSNAQEQRLHFKSEFHRFNINRKLNGLEEVSFQDYQELTIESLSDASTVSDLSSEENAVQEMKYTPYTIILSMEKYYKCFKILNLNEISLQKLKNFSWIILMVSSGHFAGGVFEKNGKIKASKTFHRYTTRRKQGGAQSAQDASGKMAKSAGSTLRRYNEIALKVTNTI